MHEEAEKERQRGRIHANGAEEQQCREAAGETYFLDCSGGRVLMERHRLALQYIMLIKNS
jgi:hypothetical protein